MLDRLCLVARELERSYAGCGVGVRIHDALFLEGSGALVMQRTLGEENSDDELVRQPHVRMCACLGQNQVQMRKSSGARLQLAATCCPLQTNLQARAQAAQRSAP